jgi:hypothetical protein
VRSAPVTSGRSHPPTGDGRDPIWATPEVRVPGVRVHPGEVMRGPAAAATLGSRPVGHRRWKGSDVPVGAGDDALRRIEAGLVADDPDLVESFRCWHPPRRGDPDDDGTTWVRGWMLLVLSIGLAEIIVGPGGVLTVVVLISIRLCRGGWS